MMNVTLLARPFERVKEKRQGIIRNKSFLQSVLEIAARNYCTEGMVQRTLDLSTKQFSLYKKGRCNYSVSQIRELALLLGMTPVEVFDIWAEAHFESTKAKRA